MKKYNVVIAGTIRNVETYIKNSLNNIDKLGEKFNNYIVIIYENDSIDNTRSILEYNKKDNYYYIFENNITEPRRTMRLSNGRNAILDKMNEMNINNYYDYLIMLDMDDTNDSGIFVDTIDSCFKYDVNIWDVLTGNQKETYYDMWALRQTNYFNLDCWGEWNKYGSNQTELHKLYNIIYHTKYENNGLIEVNSAFGGIAIYKISAIGNCKYNGEYLLSEYPDNSEKCEHVDFNECIKKNGGKIFINTEFYTNK